MLFLLSLSCFSEALPNLSVSLFAGGRTFKSQIKKEQNRLIHFPEIENSAVFVVGADGALLFSGSFSPGQGQRPEAVRTGMAQMLSSPKLPGSSANFIQSKIPTRHWRGEQIQVVQIEIFGKHGCPYCDYAYNLAVANFGADNVKEYKIEDDPLYLKKSQAVLEAAGSDLKTVPRVSAIDNKGTRWFIGGFSPDFETFVKTNTKRNVNVSFSSAPQQMVSISQSSSATDFTQQNIPTSLYQQGIPIQPEKVLQIEIFGADYCGPCQSAKASAKQYFPGKVAFYDIQKSGQYMAISNNILQAVGVRTNHGMPRISVIYNGPNGSERLFIGGQLQNFINAMNYSTSARPGYAAPVQRQSSGYQTGFRRLPSFGGMFG